MHIEIIFLSFMRIIPYYVRAGFKDSQKTCFSLIAVKKAYVHSWALKKQCKSVNPRLKLK